MWEVESNRAAACMRMCMRGRGRKCVYGYGERGAGTLGSLRSSDLGIFPSTSSDSSWGALPLCAPPSSTTQPSWVARSASPASCPALQILAGQGGAESHWVSFAPGGHQVENPGKE